MKKNFLSIIFILLINISCFSEANPNKLQKNLIEKKSDYFSYNDEFTILGEIRNFCIVYNAHYWGNNRMSGRIILFENEVPIGSYGIINDKPEVREKIIFFPDYEEKYGNTIDLSICVPSKVYLDGENILFETY